MKAQRQRVQMAEHLQRDVAHRLLGDAGEDQLAQLGQHRGHETQYAVGDDQRGGHDDEGLLRGDGHRIDHVLEHHRHADVGHLGSEQAGQRQEHPPLVAPQVGEQRLDGGQVVALAGGRLGQGALRVSSHAVQPWVSSSTRRRARPRKITPAMRSSQGATPGRRLSSRPMPPAI